MSTTSTGRSRPGALASACVASGRSLRQANPSALLFSAARWHMVSFNPPLSLVVRFLTDSLTVCAGQGTDWLLGTRRCPSSHHSVDRRALSDNLPFAVTDFSITTSPHSTPIPTTSTLTAAYQLAAANTSSEPLSPFRRFLDFC